MKNNCGKYNKFSTSIHRKFQAFFHTQSAGIISVGQQENKPFGIP
jgi:hypothetical protein